MFRKQTKSFNFHTILCCTDVQCTCRVIIGVSLLLPVVLHYFLLYKCTLYLQSTYRCISAPTGWPTTIFAVKMYNVLKQYLQVYLCSCQLANTILCCTDVQCTYRVLAGVSLFLPVGQHHSPMYRCTGYLQSTFRCISALTG